VGEVEYPGILLIRVKEISGVCKKIVLNVWGVAHGTAFPWQCFYFPWDRIFNMDHTRAIVYILICLLLPIIYVMSYYTTWLY